MQRDIPPASASAPASSATPGQQVVAQVRAGQWAEAGRLLDGQTMARRLDILEEVRAAGLLGQLEAHVDGMPGIVRPRMWAAVLAVGQHLGERWRRQARDLSPEDRDAIKDHVLRRFDAGDIQVPDLLRRASDRAEFRPAVGDEENKEWARQFLQFFGFGSPPAGQGPEMVTFNGTSHSIEYVVDMATEQAARAGRLIDPSEVYDAARLIHPTLKGPPLAAFQLVVSPTGFQVPMSGPSSILVAKGGRTRGLDQASVASIAAGVNLLLHRKVQGVKPVFEIGAFAQAGLNFNLNVASPPTSATGQSLSHTGTSVQGYIQPAVVFYNRPQGDAPRPWWLGADQFSVVGQGGLGYTWSKLPEGNALGFTAQGGPQWTWNLVGETLQISGAASGGLTWQLDPKDRPYWFVGFTVGIQFVHEFGSHPVTQPPH